MLSNNAVSIATVVFLAGGAYSLIGNNTGDIIDLETNQSTFVKKSSLELQKVTLTHQLETLKDNYSSLALDMEALKSENHCMQELLNETHTQTQVQEERIGQGERERINLWGFTNKFLEKK